MGAALELLAPRRASSSSTSSSSAAPRSTPTAPRSPTRRWRPAAPPTPCCSRRSAARSGTPRWPRTRPRRGPSRACWACARASACSPTCARCGRARRCCDASPLKRERIEGTDLLVVRELTGGIYFGESGRDGDTAHDDCAYSVGEIERIARVGFESARTKVTSVDKANVLETSRLWRETVTRVHAEEFPDVPLDHLLVDNAAMQLVSRPGGLRRDRHREPVRRHPQRRGGDAHRLARACSRAPRSAATGPGLFEPVHGSAPDIAGTGKANPLAMFGSVALMLRHGLGYGRRRRCRRIGRRPRTRGRPPDGRPRAATPPPRTPPGPSSRTSEREGSYVNTADLIWHERGVRRLGGREGTRTHPRPALRHERLRGRPRLRHRARARRSSATTTTSTASRPRPSSTTWTCPSRRSSSARPPTS